MFARLLAVKDWEILAEEEAFNVEAIALRCRVSVRTLERFFHEKFQGSPRGFVSTLRCQKAVPLLLQGFSNKAVADLLGFADETHFCHQFKRVYRVSPQNFVPINGADAGRSQSPARRSPRARASALNHRNAVVPINDRRRAVPIAHSEIDHGRTVPYQGGS
jgi:AraC-like DNA-binding protein